MIILSGVSLLGIGPEALSAEPPPWSVLSALVVLIAAGDRLSVAVRVRSVGHGINWLDVAVLIGLVAVPLPWLVLATAAGVTGSLMFRRTRMIKRVFGVAKEALLAALGGAVLFAFGAGGSLADPPPIGVLALAFLVMAAADEMISIPVIALSSRTAVRDRFQANLDIRLAATVARLLVAVLAVYALQWQLELLYALPLVVVFLFFWHERWVRARQERQAWQNLSRATEAFSGVDLDLVLRSAVVRGARLFAPDAVEVELWSGGLRRLVRGDVDRILYDGDPVAAPSEQLNVYAVALQGAAGQQDVGALRLRFAERVRVSEREQAMLQTYAAALDTAVRNAIAYGRLGEVTAAHAYAAAHDPLTSLANRRELERHLAEALAPHGGDRSAALVLLDLRHFKEVNDTLGHLAGDRTLVQIAHRFVAAARPEDLVTRFGGDEFAVLLRRCEGRTDAVARVEALLAALTEPVEVDGLPVVIEAHAGVALAVDLPVSESVEPALVELMRRADVAMYQAKRIGRGLLCYRDGEDVADRDRLALSGQLARAVTGREFVLHYQPIVDLGTGVVRGAEALVRWRHPTRGELEPRLFLDLVERSHQLPAFTAAVLDEALAASNIWRAAGHDLRVSVNISPRSLLDRSLPRQVVDALRTHRCAPDRLCLELTETLAISQLEVVDHVLSRLRDIGVHLALDDFGTGFSSLAALSRIPVHQLKIDRSFVRAMRSGLSGPVGDAPATLVADPVAQARAVVRSTVELGRALELTVVAEGIEAEAERFQLWQLGCTVGQGHLFSRAVPADRLLAELTQGVAGRPGALAAPLPSDGTVVRLPAQRRGGDDRLVQ